MKTPLPRSREEKAEAYLQAMLEIKARLNVISLMHMADWPLKLRLEVCYLQLRHICDLVAVGSVIIQGDYSSYLGDDYNPSKLFRMLEEKYEGSFPQPAKITVTNGHVKIDANSVPNAMTRAQLTQLWSWSGDKLHRLKISKFFRSYQPSAVDEMAEVNSHISKLRELLDIHILPMHNPKALVLVNLVGDTGHPQASFVEYEANGTLTIRPYTASGTTEFF